MNEPFSLLNYFDKVYCINYLEAHDRKNFIEFQMQSLGVEKDITYFGAIPLKKLAFMRDNESNLINYKRTGGCPFNLNSIGCSLSHYSCVKDAYETGLERVMIFEDDAVWIKNKDILKGYFDNLPDDWEYLYLTPSHNRMRISERLSRATDLYNSADFFVDFKSISLPGEDWWSSCCYCLGRNAMKLYVETVENHNGYCMHSDHIRYLFNNIFDSPLKTYTTNRRLVGQVSELGMVTSNETGLTISPMNTTFFSFQPMNPEDFFDKHTIRSIISK